jgi:hypothetical protein
MGGIGNQLFQIAAAYACAKRYSMELVFPESWNTKADRPPIWDIYPIKHYFNLISKEEYDRIHWLNVNEPSFSYSPIDLPSGYQNYKLIGYFQSSMYFNDYKDELRILLQPPVIRSDDMSGWIGVHVRRGDYLAAADYHMTTDAEYFKRARAEITRRIGKRAVVWITDDSEWVYKNTYEDADCVMSSYHIDDFKQLSQFKHIIMSNSTFSWWATWLNPNNYVDRIICCPDKWFGPSGPQDFETVFEPDWIRITSGNATAQLCNQTQGLSAGH